MIVLKQSTAFTFRAGPFVDSGDGVTPETELVIGQSDIQISKNGGAFAQTSDAAPVTTHDADGYYPCPLTTTDTATLGPGKVQIAMAGALPVWEDFLVIPAPVYDALVAGTGNLEAVLTAAYDAAKAAAPAGAQMALTSGAESALVTAVFAKTGLTAGGTATFAELLKALYAFARGKAEITVVSATEYDIAYYDDDDATLLHTLTVTTTGRTVA